MGRWLAALHICLAAIVFLTTTCCVQVFAKSDTPGKHAPADQPLEDSEENDESKSGADKAALSPFDRYSIECGARQHWTLISGDAWTTSNLYLGRPDLSRAPPTV